MGTAGRKFNPDRDNSGLLAAGARKIDPTESARPIVGVWIPGFRVPAANRQVAQPWSSVLTT